MNRDEALRTLGVDEDASDEEIKLAYREMAQILHPDKYNSNDKLRDRATEQFKRLNEAKDVALSHKLFGSSSRARSATASEESDREQVLRARLNGIKAARANLLDYQDSLSDGRRNGALFGAGGALVALVGFRIPFLAVIGFGLLVYGIQKIVSSSAELKDCERQLNELEIRKKKIEKKLEKF